MGNLRSFAFICGFKILPMAIRYFIGLISGTSMDGIDAALVALGDNSGDDSGDNRSGTPARIEAIRTAPWSGELRAALDKLRANPDEFPVARLARLDAEIGQAFAQAVNDLLTEAGVSPDRVRAIGSHGQTVLHRPDDEFPHSLQIGDPARIAAATGIDTVADFRRADLAAGGQGAPLAPLLHQALLADGDENRLVINLGGIANVTVLPKQLGVSGFDTGPANCFLDLWYRRHHADRFDHDGRWAGSGRVDGDCLRGLLNDDYFERPPPKSTGIEYFNPAWLESRQPAWASERPADFQATLSEFSAVSLSTSIDRFVPFRPDRVVICGGGVHNADLLRRIGAQLGGITLESAINFGIDPDYVEATLFAWLAREFVVGRALDCGPITGSRRPIRLGALWPAGR